MYHKNIMKLIDSSEKIQSYIQSQLGKIRKKKGLTQEELAFLVELSPKTISDIENNRRGISLNALIRICTALEIGIKKTFKENK